MDITNSINNNKVNFQQRLYLKHINKKDTEFFKSFAKDFHNMTKDIKGASFSLCDKGDDFVLVSNFNKNNFANVNKSQLGELNDKVRNSFLNGIVATARLFRTIEDAGLSKPSASLKNTKTVTLTANTSEIKDLEEIIKSECSSSLKK